MNSTERAKIKDFSHQTLFYWQMQLCKWKVNSHLIEVFKDYTLAKGQQWSAGTSTAKSPLMGVSLRPYQEEMLA